MSLLNFDKVIITLDAKGVRLQIDCPFALNDVVRGLPNRRFHSKSKMWLAPIIRSNANHLLNLGDRYKDHVIITPDAREKLEAALERKVWDRNDFPGWYKFAGFDPMPHQLAALNKLYRSDEIALLMEMGTSKTKVLIDIAACSRMEGVIGSLLLVCPIALRKNFMRELKTHCPIPYDAHLYVSEKKMLEWLHTRPDFPILLVGVESLSNGGAYDACIKFLTCAAKPMAAIDESTTIKNPQSIRTKKAWSFKNYTVKRAILNGSPVTRGLMDLYAQFEFLNPDILGVGDWVSFRNRYAVMGGYESKEIIGYQNMDELLDLIEPYTYQALKAEVLKDLPPKQGPFELTVQLTPEQKNIYNLINKKKIIKTGGDDYVIKNSLEKALRLQQVCGGFYAEPNGEGTYRVNAIDGKNPKLSLMLDFLEDKEDSVIIWTPFKHEITMIVGALREKYGHDAVVELHGEVNEEQRDINVYELFEKKKARFLVGNPVVGGMGLTMIACTLMIYFTNSHSFFHRSQSEDRAHRKGQINSVRYYDMVCENTVDEDVRSCLLERLDLADYIRLQLKNRADLIGMD